MMGISSVWADIGDVYYCDVLKDISLKADGRVVENRLSKFKFKLLKESIEWGNESPVDTSLPYQITYLVTKSTQGLIGDNWKIPEMVNAKTSFAHFSLYDGKLSWNHITQLRSFIADCEIFD